MANVVRFKSSAVPIYLEVVCPECVATQTRPSDVGSRLVPCGAEIVNNEIGQAFRCPNCNSKLVVATEALVVKLLEEEGEGEFK